MCGELIMKYVLFFVVGYVVLYAVVWFHEVGHSLWYRKYNLKKDWWNVQVKPYIFFSTPGAADEKVWQSLKPIQYVLIAYGGVMANAVFAVLAGVVICVIGKSNVYLLFALWLFMTLHLGEIVSYLFVGSVFLVSDMKLVNQFMPQLRVPNIIIGAVLSAVYVYLLTIVPEEIRAFVIIFNSITVVSMCVGRIISSTKAKRKE